MVLSVNVEEGVWYQIKGSVAEREEEKEGNKNRIEMQRKWVKKE